LIIVISRRVAVNVVEVAHAFVILSGRCVVVFAAHAARMIQTAFRYPLPGHGEV